MRRFEVVVAAVARAGAGVAAASALVGVAVPRLALCEECGLDAALDERAERQLDEPLLQLERRARSPCAGARAALSRAELRDAALSRPSPSASRRRLEERRANARGRERVDRVDRRLVEPRRAPPPPPPPRRTAHARCRAERRAVLGVGDEAHQRAPLPRRRASKAPRPPCARGWARAPPAARARRRRRPRVRDDRAARRVARRLGERRLDLGPDKVRAVQDGDVGVARGARRDERAHARGDERAARPRPCGARPSARARRALASARARPVPAAAARDGGGGGDAFRARRAVAAAGGSRRAARPTRASDHRGRAEIVRERSSRTPATPARGRAAACGRKLVEKELEVVHVRALEAASDRLIVVAHEPSRGRSRARARAARRTARCSCPGTRRRRAG